MLLPERGIEGVAERHGTRAIRRILLVEDEEGIRATLSVYLKRERYEVHGAAEADEARTLLALHRFDLVLTDISLPGTTGIELLREVKAHHPGVDVIVITGHMDISYAIEAMREGAWDFFTKPFSLEKIALTISRLDEKRRYQDKARQYELLSEQRDFENQAAAETTFALARAVEERDRYNIGHGRRTSNYAVLLGHRLQFTEDRIRSLRHGALVHDIGKIGIDDKILNKPGRLTEEEFAHIRRHPEIGDYILKPISMMQNLAPMVRHHHERWDGSGYPDRLEGDRIPLEARILCIADYFDSITSARPYRLPMTMDEAIQQMLRERGKAFDPLLIELFLDELARSDAA